MTMIRQGDVGLRPVDAIPDGKMLTHTVLAEGEVTGHTHRITEGQAEIVDVQGTWYLRVTSPTAILSHEEHAAVTIPCGHYEIVRQREYSDDVEWRRVRD